MSLETDYGYHYHTGCDDFLHLDWTRAKTCSSEAKLMEASIFPKLSVSPQQCSSEDTLLSIPSLSHSGSSGTPIPDTSSSSGDISTEDADEDETLVVQYPSLLQSNAQNRSQLLQRFFDLHIGASSSARRIFAYEALDTSSGTKIATRAAMDTLCVAQIATTFRDSKLMREAKSLYRESLRLLSSQMERINPKPNKAQLDDVIGALHALTACAWFSCLANADDLEWMRYPQATLKILEVYGWHTINLSTGRTFYYNWKYRAFFDALIRRTKISFTEPPDPFTIDSPGCLLTEHAYDVPGLLWRSDKFVEAAKSNLVDPYMVIRLLTEIGASISRLKHWNLQWIKHFPPRSNYRTVGTKTFRAFKALCGEHFNVFPLAYDFSNAQHERDIRIFSMCVLNLDQAIMDINEAFPEHCKSEQLKLQLREAELSAETCAADLCMLIPWSAQPQNMSFAAIHSFLPLHFASTYYERQGKFQQLAWCRTVTKSLSTKYGIEIRYPK